MQFESLLNAIAKVCGYSLIGDEKCYRLLKIYGKIEEEGGQVDYFLEDRAIISETEAIRRLKSHESDAVIVQAENGKIYLRSRPRHCMWHLRIGSSQVHCEDIDVSIKDEEITSFFRIVGSKKGRCIWGFINGVDNTREEALASAKMISKKVGGEEIFTLQNDTWGKKDDVLTCIVLKISVDTPAVKRAIEFVRHPLSLGKQKHECPIVIFAHSQGAIIMEHVLEKLILNEKEKLRVFNFGCGSVSQFTT